MKVKSESEVAQSRLTLSDPMDWSLPGSSAHGIFQARVLEWGAEASGLPEFSSCSPSNGGSCSLSGHFLLEALPDHPTQVTRLPGHVLSQHPSYPLQAHST